MINKERYDYLLNTIRENPESKECFLWPFKKDSRGRYGRVVVDGAKKRVHQLAYITFRSLIPPRMYVLHTCDQPSCFNPNHLYLGTQKDNMCDCVERGRFVSNIHNTRGKRKKGKRKIPLTPEEVREIRRLYETTQGASHTIARQFNICPSNLWHIVNRKTFKNIL